MWSFSLRRAYPCGRILVSVPGEFTGWMENAGSSFLSRPHGCSAVFIETVVLVECAHVYSAWWELAHGVLGSLREETEALCCYSWETLKGVHPVLMGNEVTQPPGIPRHPVIPSGSRDACSRVYPGRPHYGFCLGVSCVLAIVRIQVCGYLLQLGAGSPLGPLALCNVQQFSALASCRHHPDSFNCLILS